MKWWIIGAVVFGVLYGMLWFMDWMADWICDGMINFCTNTKGPLDHVMSQLLA